MPLHVSGALLPRDSRYLLVRELPAITNKASVPQGLNNEVSGPSWLDQGAGMSFPDKKHLGRAHRLNYLECPSFEVP